MTELLLFCVLVGLSIGVLVVRRWRLDERDWRRLPPPERPVTPADWRRS